MSPRVLPLTLLVAATLLGCDALGGSADSIVAPKPTFAVRFRTPSPGREGIPVNTQISITFSEPIDPSTVDVGVLTVNGRSDGELEVDGPTLRFTPSGGFDPGTAYAIALGPEIAGTNGIALGPYAVWGFKTAGTPPTQDTVLLVRPRR